MLRAIQSPTVCLHSVEEQYFLRATPTRVHNYRDHITRFEGLPIPSLTDHDADTRSLDIPCAYRGRVFRISPNDDDDVAMRVLPPILLNYSSKRHILGHIEHRARMMREGRVRGG